MQRPFTIPWFPRVLALGLTLGLAGPGQAEATEEDDDFHFRPFWVEPADRVDFGHGHLVGGIDHEMKPEKGTRQRTALPLEATLGLGAGFSVVLVTESGAMSIMDDHSRDHGVTRAAKLRYSLPEWNGLHFMVLAGADQASGHGDTTRSTGYSLALDTAIGTFGWGQTWDRQRPEDVRSGKEAALNLFRTGLGGDGRWALGGEIRHAHLASGTTVNYWLLGVGRVVGKGLMADLAVGAGSGDQAARRITAGLSWFF